MPKATLMGFLAAFDDIVKAKLGLVLVFFSSNYPCPLQEVVYYLVKWCSLPYEDSTWELKDDVDQSKIEEFEQLQAVKPDSRRVVSQTCIFPLWWTSYVSDI